MNAVIKYLKENTQDLDIKWVREPPLFMDSVWLDDRCLAKVEVIGDLIFIKRTYQPSRSYPLQDPQSIMNVLNDIRDTVEIESNWLRSSWRSK